MQQPTQQTKQQFDESIQDYNLINDFHHRVIQSDVNVNLEGENVTLQAGYDPLKDSHYMGITQRAYFKFILQSWKTQLSGELKETLDYLQDGEDMHGLDFADMASNETDVLLELRTRDRYTKLIKKIDKALLSIELHNYGFCEETGEEIGIPRLLARPIATLSIKAQEKHEKSERNSDIHDQATEVFKELEDEKDYQ